MGGESIDRESVGSGCRIRLDCLRDIFDMDSEFEPDEPDCD